MLEKTLESPLYCKKIQPVNSKGSQSWIFIKRTDSEAEALILWPPDLKSWLTGKDPDAGKGWRQEEKGMTEDEMVGWHHRLNEHSFDQALRDSEGQGSLACCFPLGLQRVRHSWATEQTNIVTKNVYQLELPLMDDIMGVTHHLSPFFPFGNC